MSNKMDDNQKENKKTSQRTGRSSREIGGYKGLEPTRYGDWEKKGRCIDF